VRETILHALTDVKEPKESAKFGEAHVSKIVYVMHLEDEKKTCIERGSKNANQTHAIY